MKWFLFRLFVAYYHWKQVGDFYTYGFYDCWRYAASFKGSYFDSAEWRTLRADAEFSVHEDFTYWTE